MSTNTKHSPAPWRVARHESSKTGATLIDIADATSHSIASLGLATDRKAADAALLAAAPELLEALRIASFALETVAHLTGREAELLPTVELAKAAVAKAEGRA